MEHKSKCKYVVLHKPTNKWVTSSYYKTNDCLSKSLLDAYEFTAFELKLASVTRLKAKSKYKVYKIKKVKKEEVLLYVE